MRGLVVLETLAQVQIQRLFPLVVEAVAEVERAERGVQAEKDAGCVDVAAVEVVVVVPGAAALQRQAQVCLLYTSRCV